MTKTNKIKEEIERMMDVYEIYELSEESGLQDQFEVDINNLLKEERKQATADFNKMLDEMIELADECVSISELEELKQMLVEKNAN
jgi:hypothetical protein